MPGCVALQVAALNHFMSQPTSFLAAAALDGPRALEEACASLTPAALAEVRGDAPGAAATSCQCLPQLLLLLPL